MANILKDCFIFVLIIRNCCCFGNRLFDPEANGLERRQNILLAALKDSESQDPCRLFTFHPQSIRINGDEFQLIGDGYSPEECQSACADQVGFSCTVALMQLPAICYITGFKTTYHIHSRHYTKICLQASPNCYRKKPNTSAGFTELAKIPESFQGSAILSEQYCMERCDTKQSCVAFDIKLVRNETYCAFPKQSYVEAGSFESYTRQCLND